MLRSPNLAHVTSWPSSLFLSLCACFFLFCSSINVPSGFLLQRTPSILALALLSFRPPCLSAAFVPSFRCLLLLRSPLLSFSFFLSLAHPIHCPPPCLDTSCVASALRRQALWGFAGQARWRALRRDALEGITRSEARWRAHCVSETALNRAFRLAASALPAPRS